MLIKQCNFSFSYLFLLFSFLLILIVQNKSEQLGFTGCKYQGPLCSPAEICVDDGLFGVCVRRDDAETVRIVSEEPVPVSTEALVELRAALELLVNERSSWRDPITQCVLRRWRLERLYERNHNQLPGGERAAIRLVESCGDGESSETTRENEVEDESAEAPLTDGELHLLERMLEEREKRYDSDNLRIHKYEKHSAPGLVARAVADEEAAQEDTEARRDMLKHLQREVVKQETRVAELLLRARLRQRHRHPPLDEAESQEGSAAEKRAEAEENGDDTHAISGHAREDRSSREEPASVERAALLGAQRAREALDSDEKQPTREDADEDGANELIGEDESSAMRDEKQTPYSARARVSDLENDLDDSSSSSSSSSEERPVARTEERERERGADSSSESASESESSSAEDDSASSEEIARLLVPVQRKSTVVRDSLLGSIRLFVEPRFSSASAKKNFSQTISTLFKLPEDSFITNDRTGINEVRITVTNNMNPTEIVSKIWNLRHDLKSMTGYEVTGYSVSSEELSEHISNEKRSAPEEEEAASTGILSRASKAVGPHVLVLALVIVGLVAGLVVGAMLLFAMRRRARRQQTLSDKLEADALSAMTAGPSDSANIAEHSAYEDLCRQRMQNESAQSGGGIGPLLGNLKCKLIGSGRFNVFSKLGFGARTEAAPVMVAASDRKHVKAAPRRIGSASSQCSNSDETTINLDISTGHAILSCMEEFLSNGTKIESDWENLRLYEAEAKTMSVARTPVNICKNRFIDVLPYDHTRVVLDAKANSNGSDYINASFIHDHDPRQPLYIVSQGPLSNTVADLWQLVWEQGVSVIVNLCSSTSENPVTTEKAATDKEENSECARYWPGTDEGILHLHGLDVQLVSEHEASGEFVVRSLFVRHLATGETRTVSLFHFFSWPAHGLPSSPRALLDFRRKVNKCSHGKRKPVLIHCSDGAGRSGTYALVDLVLRRVTQGNLKELNVSATAEHLRDYRPEMIRSKAQFEFALQCIAEDMHAILKQLGAQ